MPLTSYTKDRMPHVGHISRAVRNPTCFGVLKSIIFIVSVSVRHGVNPVALPRQRRTWAPLAAEAKA